MILLFLYMNEALPFSFIVGVARSARRPGTLYSSFASASRSARQGLMRCPLRLTGTYLRNRLPLSHPPASSPPGPAKTPAKTPISERFRIWHHQLRAMPAH